MTDAAAQLYQLSYEISPIILNNGIANPSLGGLLPIVSILQASSFVQGILSGSDLTDLNQFFAHFKPMPGGTLVEQEVATYPFANQNVAANAVIATPLHISLMMVAPATGRFGYASKIATMIALQTILAKHNSLGGTYVVVTPAAVYTSCLLTRLSDVTRGTEQPQVEWQWDFLQPLTTLNQAQAAYNVNMSKLTQAVPTDGSWSGLANTVAQPSSGAGASLVPAAANTQGGIYPQPDLPQFGPSITSSPLG